MRAVNIVTGRVYGYGDEVPIYKAIDIAGMEWVDTGENGIFEEVTHSCLVNFLWNGKPRQCMPEGIGCKIEN